MTPDSASNGDDGLGGSDEDNGSVSRGSDSYVEIRDHEGDVESEDLNLVIWGRIWDFGRSEPLAVYWELNSEQETNESDEDNDGDGDVQAENNLIAILSDNDDLENYDPNQSRDQFYRKLADFSIDDAPAPEATLKEYRRKFNSYLSVPRVQWIFDFTREENNEELTNWIEGLLDEFYIHGNPQYQINVKLADTKDESIESPEFIAEEQDEDETEDDNDSDTNQTKLNISLINNPSSGVPISDLREGMEVFFRIVGEETEQLPDNMIDEESSNPSSIPMTGPIVSLEDASKELLTDDTDPEMYKEVTVEIEPAIKGSGLVFEEDKIKIPLDSEESETDLKDDLLLVGLIGVFILAFVALVIFL